MDSKATYCEWTYRRRQALSTNGVVEGKTNHVGFVMNIAQGAQPLVSS